MLDKIYSVIPPSHQLPSLRCRHIIVSPSHQVRTKTTSTEVFLVTCLKWLGKHRAAQTTIGDDKGFHNLTPRRLVPEPWL
jgi:hypothetical protein